MLGDGEAGRRRRTQLRPEKTQGRCNEKASGAIPPFPWSFRTPPPLPSLQWGHFQGSTQTVLQLHSLRRLPWGNLSQPGDDGSQKSIFSSVLYPGLSS